MAKERKHFTTEIKIKRTKKSFAALMITTGILVLSYPLITHILANRNATKVVQEYNDTVQEMKKEEIDSLKEAAKSYNEQLGQILIENEAGEGKKQNSHLDLVNLGAALGYITIPKLELNLPIYEGTSDDVLSQGIGHLTETSYPLGGESTHSALSGHRGMAEKELFTNLDKVGKGDQFYLHILDEILAYQIDQIEVVEPSDISSLQIIKGQDLCTLVTCTPIGINSHRLLVRGHRVPYTGEEDGSDILYQSVHTGTVIQRIMEIWPWMALALLLMIGAEGALMILVLKRMKTRMEDD